MSRLRYDVIQRRWVIISTDRAAEPSEFAIERDEVRMAFSPFSEGNEARTPPDIYAIWEGDREPNSPGWQVRVVPNKFPVLGIEGTTELVRQGLFEEMDGVGVHEVVIDSPLSEPDLADLPPEQVGRVFLACRERIRDLVCDRRLRYLLVFKNHGAEAGSPISHTHTQIIGLPVTPSTVRLELTSARDYLSENSKCLFCDIARQESEFKERVILETDLFLAWAPFASRFPYEMMIAPKGHAHDFADADDTTVNAFGAVVQHVLGRLKSVLRDPPYNFVLHTSPNTDSDPRLPNYWSTIEKDYHWHLEIIPRVTPIAGFEWGTGFYINPMPPEAAARSLKITG